MSASEHTQDDKPENVLPPWRPSKYEPSMCQRVIEYGRQGKSKTWMAAELGVCRATINNWEKEFPDFLDAITHAMVLSQKWWEDKGQESLSAQHFQSSVWSRSMGARFPAEWRETKREEQTGPDGGPVQQEVTQVTRVIVDPDNSNA